jgi:hypothetical protein
MSTSIETPRQCGNCQLFQAPVSGGNERMYCRAPLGLVLGRRYEENPCAKPESFTPLNGENVQSIDTTSLSGQIFPAQTE